MNVWLRVLLFILKTGFYTWLEQFEVEPTPALLPPKKPKSWLGECLWGIKYKIESIVWSFYGRFFL